MRLRGAWDLFSGADLVGRETWRLGRAGGARQYHATIARTAPVEHTQTLRLDLTGDHLPAALAIHVDLPGGSETVAGEFAPGRWTFRIRRTGVEVVHEVEADPASHLDYLSPVFNTATLLRLDLDVGEEDDIVAVYLEPVGPASFTPRLVRQRYERLSDGAITVVAGTFAAERYRYTNLETGWTGEIAADEFGTVLRYPGVCELASYEVLPDQA